MKLKSTFPLKSQSIAPISQLGNEKMWRFKLPRDQLKDLKSGVLVLYPLADDINDLISFNDMLICVAFGSVHIAGSKPTDIGVFIYKDEEPEFMKFITEEEGA